ncbi:MAG: Tol-Pal system beta propeller repeat protein TolB [Alcanivoracaceae bacterium]|nr:Tol-Pal system beta propeller repeat protein TolB [Alcanivoracaceae bacterium]
MIRLFSIIISIFLAGAVQAQLMIQVTEGRVDAVPIAVVPFASGGAAAPEQIDGIIAANLHRSGQFRPLPAEDMLSRPSRGDEISYRDFRVLGSEFMVVGRVDALPAGDFRVSYELHDVPRGARLISETYQVQGAKLRDVAHAISDRVYEQLTGVRGAFATRILYVTHNRGADYPFQLQYADADGARVRTVLRSREPIMSPSWSPDGKQIAYVSFEANGMPGVYIHELATMQRQLISSFKGINGAPDWSPDGGKLALTLSRDGNPEIYVLDIASRQLTRMTNHFAIDTEARWLPDGKSLVFTSSRGGGPQIYRLDMRDKSVRRVSFEGDYNSNPAVTPDGRYLAYIHRKGGQYHVAVQDLQRNTFNIVTSTEQDESPSVAPNGSMIIYATKHRGTGVLQAVSVDGRIKVHLPSKEGEVREPSWSPFFQ